MLKRLCAILFYLLAIWTGLFSALSYWAMLGQNVSVFSIQMRWVTGALFVLLAAAVVSAILDKWVVAAPCAFLYGLGRVLIGVSVMRLATDWGAWEFIKHFGNAAFLFLPAVVCMAISVRERRSSKARAEQTYKKLYS